jgi:alpha-galactosidase/6-phospho-beta-glucosidase family protein
MDVLEEDELANLTKSSKLVKKYNEEIDRESAYELLIKKIETAEKEEVKAKVAKQKEAEKRSSSRTSRSSSSSTQRSIIRALTSPTVIRSVLGILGKMMR